jgi:imidazolonepropionase-like amidohydrolase
MRRTLPFPAALLALAVLLTACTPSPSATLAITGVTLIDGTGRGPRGPVTVLVDGERIAAVGPAAEVVVPAGAEVVDGAGRFLIPGLWDAHVHLAYDPDEPFAPEDRLPMYLAYGVVGVRDMGSDPERIAALEAAVASGEVPGPAIVSPGPYLDGPQPERSAVVPVATAEEARAAARRLMSGGADFLKVQAGLSRDAYFAILEEASALGVPVYGHVPDALTAAEVARAGQRSTEHLSPALPSDGAIFFSCSAREEELRRELAAIDAAREAGDADREELRERTRALQRALLDSYDEEKAVALFATLRAEGVRVVPTLVWSRSYSPPDPELPDELALGVLPPAERKRWQEIWERYFDTADADTLELNARLDLASRDLAGDLHHAGVTLLAGSDSTFGFVLPGDSLHRELELLVAAGLSPEEAIVAATRSVAEVLGRLGDAGTVEAGKVADLLLLDADPLADVRNTRGIRAVVRGGVLRRRADLDRMLERGSRANVAAADRPSAT